MRHRTHTARVLLIISAAFALALSLAGQVAAGDRPEQRSGQEFRGMHSLRAPVTKENFYFVMADRFANGDQGNDRGGIPGDRLQHGFDPTSKGFYNGGDLAGLLDRIDYIQGLGTSAIWLTPSFKNKAVQLEDGPSAGYHGYWITDFTQIDPHLGTNAELRALVDAAHARGMKVYFDIITNHTADVIGYEQGARQPYVSKDVEPYRTAAGEPFDDRDHAGTDGFPALSPTESFPYTPILDADESSLKVPGWLNDVSLYHNRGDTTFVGEDSYYGDFFGLDDLFTEHPRVVEGMTAIYQSWIRDMGIDGFRIDTMKHVNDEFWHKFGPEVLDFAHRQGKDEFFMFGEVFDTTKAFTSHFTTSDRMQAVLDFPFQDAARNFASRGQPTDSLRSFFEGDDWYTDADSNVYQLPTFLGNHDMGRIGHFVSADNPGAPGEELVARDLLAHELMYFSRGNPVIYYGDEQGFTGSGGDQLARQSMFASEVPDYADDDLLGTDRTHAEDNFQPAHPIYQRIRALADLTREHPALRDGAHQHRWSSPEPGIYAFSRVGRGQQHEYVVAVNNSESPKTAPVPTYVGNGAFSKIYGDGPSTATSDSDRTLALTVPPLSSVVYRSDSQIPRSHAAPRVTLGDPAPSTVSRSRMHLTADVAGSSFYEVTFYAKHGGSQWRQIGTDDTAPYQVFHDTSGRPAGSRMLYAAVVLDNAGHTSRSNVARATVPAPELTFETPGGKVRGVVEVRVVADPERSDHEVRFERSVAGGDFTEIGVDDSSPAYTVFDDVDALDLPEGTDITYRATLALAGGGTVTATRTVEMAGPPPAAATVHYLRPAGDYGDPPGDGWGLHLWGSAVDPAVLAQVTWDNPWPRARVESGWAEYDIALADASKPVNFIMHLPGGDSVPATREPGGDRSFVPIDSPEVWIVQGDPTVYTTKPLGAP